MGVIATGSIFKTLTFDGRSSSEFNVYITGEGVFNAPERAVEMISIPGRNGAFALDNGRFENIEVTYNCGIAGDSDTDFAEAVSAFRNWLCSRNGYVRLTDDYNANEYRMAIYKSGLEVTAERLIAGEFPIVFECKPQRFLTSGEEKITVGEWGETTTETGDIVEIENPDGILSVKSLTADIEPIQEGTGDPSPTNIRPITGWTDCEVTQTGFNQWDEEWELGAINPTTGATETANNRIRSKNYTRCVGGLTYYIKEPTTTKNARLIYYDADKAYLGESGWTGNETKTIPQGAVFFKFYMSATYGTTYNDDICINISSDRNGDYEPYNGTTYSTALGSTVYGGTLDIVSGELTITHGYVDLGTLTWYYTSGNDFFYTGSGTLSDRKAGSTNFICSSYNNIGNAYDATMKTAETGSIAGGFGSVQIKVKNTAYTDAATFKTAMSGVQLVYELATPTTTTLTAQQVQLLLGTNNIWADTGDVTVEFGQNPNILVNPTLFESRPMLEVTGYGNINLGSDTIEIHNELIGDIIIYGRNSWESGSTRTITVDTQFANNGDRIYISNGPRFATDCLVEWSVPAGTITSSTITGSGDGDANITALSNKTIRISADIFNSEFYFGTAATKTAAGALSITTSNYGTLTGNISATLAYDGDSTFTLSRSVTKPAQLTSANPYTSIGDITLTSSQPTLGNPIYIDLNIGEAYKIENDVPVSVNNGVVIPAELPTLAPGANMVTCDNTITELDIVPRWWKI